MLAGRCADQSRLERAPAGRTAAGQTFRRSLHPRGMKRRRLQLSPRHRLALGAVSLCLLISGAAWLWVHRLDEAGRAGDSLRAFKPWLMKLHGYAALGFVFLFGMLWAGHVRRAWH